MVKPCHTKKSTTFFRRGLRCYGLDISSTMHVYIHGIFSWSVSKLWNVLDNKFPEFCDHILAIKRYPFFRKNSYFIIKVKSKDFNLEDFKNKFCCLFPNCTVNNSRCNRRNHKISITKERKRILSHNDHVIDISLSDYNPSVCNTSFCLSWNTNGWNPEKKDGIEYFITVFKPMFLCFQETGNGSRFRSNCPCKVSLPNYTSFFKRKDSNVQGMRGLYIGCHKSYQAALENYTFKFIISITTYNIGNTKCSIGNVYIPVKKHRLEWLSAWDEVRNWLSDHVSHASILLGDFNFTTDKLSSFLSKSADSSWSVLPINGSNISWSKGHNFSDIDHAIVNQKMLELLSYARFIDDYPLSDHKPLLLYNKTLPSDSFSFPKKFVRWDRKKCISNADNIFNNNMFSVLEDNFLNGVDQSSDTLVKNFIDSTYKLADELQITSIGKVKKHSFKMSKKIYVLQKLKMNKYKLIKKHGNLKNLDEFVRLTSSFKKLCHSIKRKCNQIRNEKRQHWINIGCNLAMKNDHKGNWNWIKKTAKTGTLSSTTLQPVKDPNGNLVFSTDDQLKVWYDHYKNLTADKSHRSLYKPFWYNPVWKKLLLFRKHKSWNINQEITRKEIQDAILSIPNFKASGPDGIPIEFFKAIVCKKNPDDNSNHGYNFLHLLFNNIWDGDFPESWNNASIVSIPKKGDLSDCNNYRGISLINNGIKILSKIVASRISDYAIKHKFIRPEQFGFRSKEECISLFISIREICQRRQFKGKSTYLAFLDLKKAYDSVPIFNILSKIESLGIRGKCFRFIKNLYLTSKANVRINMEFSESFRIERGVRQGCPLSPILFNLFINDVFKGCKKYGVKFGNSYCCGGLFADDIVLCAPTKRKLKKLLKKTSKWANDNLMTFGINKCATMVVRPKNYTGNSNDPIFKINGVPIPQTTCYTYLGVPFDNKLSLKPIISHLRTKVRKALFSVKGFLRNNKIPLIQKKRLFNSVIIGRISYYAPLLGSNKTRTKSLQTLINYAFYWMAGFNNPNSFISLYSITKEFNIPPLSAKCAIAQVRCFNKWKDSQCIIGNLVNNIPPMRYFYTWTKESKTLDRKLSKNNLEDPNEIKEYYWDRDLFNNSSKAKMYKKYHFESTRCYIDQSVKYPQFTLGFLWLLRIRCGYRLDAAVAIAAGFVSENIPRHCFFCKGGTQTFTHWILVCPYFNYIRVNRLGNTYKLLDFFKRFHSASNPRYNQHDNLRHIGAARTSLLAIENRYIHNLDSNFLSSYTVLEIRNVLYFLLGGRLTSNREIFSNREWAKLFKCQTDAGEYSHIPYMIKLISYLNMIVPVVAERKRLLFDKYKLDHTKSVKADIPVRQASRANATSRYHNFYLEARLCITILSIVMTYCLIRSFIGF